MTMFTFFNIILRLKIKLYTEKQYSRLNTTTTIDPIKISIDGIMGLDNRVHIALF